MFNKIGIVFLNVLPVKKTSLKYLMEIACMKIHDEIYHVS